MRLIYLTVFFLLATVFLLTGCTSRGVPAESRADAQSDAGAAGGAAPGAPEEPRALLTLSDAGSRTGDLILVRADMAYDFDANASLDLVSIREAQTYEYPVEREDFMLSAKVMPYLDAMIRDCDEAMGSSVTSVSSAWRSEEYQQSVWDSYAELYGEEYSEKYVAVPGFSEHHTGLAVDLGIIYEDGSEGAFSESGNAVWAAENAHRYGFVRRYAEDKTAITGISNEAWHFRYVGQPHAAYMYEKNLCLEEYLELLRERTSQDEPLVIALGERQYAVFYTAERSIPEPEGSFRISGDNAGGYIVTVSADA